MEVHPTGNFPSYAIHEDSCYRKARTGCTQPSRRRINWPSIEIIPLGRPKFDLTRADTLHDAIVAAKPDLVISAAAYTAVDLAEDEPELALAINAHGAGTVAQAAAASGAPVVHLSTDYVFSEEGETPRTETGHAAFMARPSLMVKRQSLPPFSAQQILLNGGPCILRDERDAVGSRAGLETVIQNAVHPIKGRGAAMAERDALDSK